MPYANSGCRRNIEMTPLRKAQTAPSRMSGLREDGPDGGGVDERQGVRAARRSPEPGGRIRIADACTLLGLKRRQVFRLLSAFRTRGAVSLVSSRRGRPSNNRLPAAVRELAVAIVRERYADFGPMLACEKLSQRHGCRVSRETLRQWMIAEGLWLDRRQRPPSVHQPRNRRARVGELVQIGGSQHFWFENRGPECALLASVDDATSRILHAAFVPTESTFDDLRETRAYVARFGRPIAYNFRQARHLPGEQARGGRRQRHDP